MSVTLGNGVITGVVAGGMFGVPFASGTAMLFAQTTAPTGWTKSTTHNNKALRVVTGTAGSGGTVDFTTAFASRAVGGTLSNTTATGTVGNHTLATDAIPSHAHSGGVVASGSASGNNPNLGHARQNTGATGGGGAHNHGFTGTAHTHTFTGTAIDLRVQYVDVIIATKAA
jgi:hypothetical protein